MLRSHRNEFAEVFKVFLPSQCGTTGEKKKSLSIDEVFIELISIKKAREIRAYLEQRNVHGSVVSVGSRSGGMIEVGFI